jgi:hypothetical protein
MRYLLITAVLSVTTSTVAAVESPADARGLGARSSQSPSPAPHRDQIANETTPDETPIRPQRMEPVVATAKPVTAPKVAHSGTGAFSDGASLRLNGGSGNLLERLRQLETDLAATVGELEARNLLVTDLRHGLDDEKARSEALTGKVEYLEHARVSLDTARQEVADRGRTIEDLRLQLAQSELSRLRAERFLYEISSDLLALEVGDATALGAIQSRVRVRIANTERPTSGTVPKAPTP